MADINQVVSLGIGTPAGVPEFLTLGLQIGAELIPDPTTVGITYRAPNMKLEYRAPNMKLEYRAPSLGDD